MLVRERISEGFANSVVHELRELILETSSVGLIFNGDLHSLNSLKIQVNFSPRGRRCLGNELQGLAQFSKVRNIEIRESRAGFFHVNKVIEGRSNESSMRCADRILQTKTSIVDCETRLGPDPGWEIVRIELIQDEAEDLFLCSIESFREFLNKTGVSSTENVIDLFTETVLCKKLYSYSYSYSYINFT